MREAREAAIGECARFLERNPDVEQVELLLVDSNGIPRGKWLPAPALASVASSGLRLPVSVLGETTALSSPGGPDSGLLPSDPDGVCFPVPGTLSRVPWRGRPAAQLLVRMSAEDGESPHPFDSRGILERAQRNLARRGLFPVAAVELEFSLFRKTDRPGAPPQPLARFDRSRLYEIDALEEIAPFLERVREVADVQRVPLAGTIAEMAPGQLEINLSHVPDACRAADHAVLLRRIVKRVAHAHGMDATFMAKPSGAAPGNGCHVHVSLQSEAGKNRFDEPGAAPGAAGPTLRRAVAGLIETASDAQLAFAPNANSFRRFAPGHFAPVQAAWGYDHRMAAVRVPAAHGPAARFEHRIAGADAQPYLVLAAILGGVGEGLDRDMEPPEPLRCDERSTSDAQLSESWREATNRFAESGFVTRVFGDAFQRLYASMKRLERSEFMKDVPDVELKAYFLRA